MSNALNESENLNNKPAIETDEGKFDLAKILEEAVAEALPDQNAIAEELKITTKDAKKPTANKKRFENKGYKRSYPLSVTMEVGGKITTFNTPEEAYNQLTDYMRDKYIHLLEVKNEDIKSAIKKADKKLDTTTIIKGGEKEEGVVEIMQSLIDMQLIRIKWEDQGKRKYIPVDKTVIGSEEIAEKANKRIAEIINERKEKADKIKEALGNSELLEDLKKTHADIMENAQNTVKSKKTISKLLEPFIEAGIINSKKYGNKTVYISNDIKNKELTELVKEINKKCDEIDKGIQAKAKEYEEISKNGFEETIKKDGKEVAKFAYTMKIEKIPGTTQKAITIEKLIIKFGHNLVPIQEGLVYISTNNKTPQFLKNALVRLEAAEKEAKEKEVEKESAAA